MEPSESLDYYKLKDELNKLLRDEIARSVENERDLQQKYIGVALKIAAAGLAAAIVVIGLFGIKSFYDINSEISKIPELIKTRINQEVTARFDANNPVAKYELTLLESAAKSVGASIATQADRSSIIELDDRTSDVILRALGSKDIQLETKLPLIDALGADGIRSVSPSIDLAVIALARGEGDEEFVRHCIKYFSARNPERFAADADKIYDAHQGSSQIRLALGRYAVYLPKERGEDFIKKLEKSDDPRLKYLLHVRDLIVGRAKQLNKDLFNDVLTQAFNTDAGDEIGLTDIVDYVESIDESDLDTSEIVTQMLDAIRQYAESMKSSLAVENPSIDQMSFRFYLDSGKPASASMDRKHFSNLSALAASRIRESLRQSKGEFTDPIKQSMDFWFPRSQSDTKSNAAKAGAFGYRDPKNVRLILADGKDTQLDTQSTRAVITTQGTGDSSRVVLKWNNEIGETKTVSLKAIVDFNSGTRFISSHGIWNRVSDDD